MTIQRGQDVPGTVFCCYSVLLYQVDEGRIGKNMRFSYAFIHFSYPAKSRLLILFSLFPSSFSPPFVCLSLFLSNFTVVSGCNFGLAGKLGENL